MSKVCQMPVTCALELSLQNGIQRLLGHCKTVPGSFELIYGAQQMTKNDGFDAIIILGSVIKGETPHFDYICQGVTYGIARLNASQNIPVIYGLLTTNDLQQAKDRSGGKLGNKGDECAIDAIKMAKF